MPRTLIEKQRIFVLKQWWMSGKTLRTVNTALWKEYPDIPTPTWQAIYQLAKKFDETGSVEGAPRSGRPRTVSTEENSELVSKTFRSNPQLTERRASNELGIARRSWFDVFHEFPGKRVLAKNTIRSFNAIILTVMTVMTVMNIIAVVVVKDTMAVMDFVASIVTHLLPIHLIEWSSTEILLILVNI